MEPTTKSSIAQMIVSVYGFGSAVMAVLTGLSVAPLFGLEKSLTAYFSIVFLCFWTIFLFFTGMTLFSFTHYARVRIIVVSLFYVASGLLLEYSGLAYVNLPYAWTTLSCWSPPSSCAACECALSSPLAASAGTVVLIVAVIGLIIFTISKGIRDQFA